MSLRKGPHLEDLQGTRFQRRCYRSCPSSMMPASMAHSKTCWRTPALRPLTSTSIRWRYWMFHREAQVLPKADLDTPQILICLCTGQLMSPLREYKTAPELQRSKRPSVRLMYEFQDCDLRLSVNNLVDSPLWIILHQQQAKRSMLFSICTQYRLLLWLKEFKA